MTIQNLLLGTSIRFGIMWIYDGTVKKLKLLWKHLKIIIVTNLKNLVERIYTELQNVIKTSNNDKN